MASRRARAAARRPPARDAPGRAAAGGSPPRLSKPSMPNARCVEFLRTALEHALAHLDPRDRLRLGLYYAQQLTLAETGRLLKEHEATTSRQLARTRKTVRDEVEKKLRGGGLSDAEIARCFECASKDVRYDESGRDARTGSQAAQGIRRGSFYMKRESMAGEGERDLWLGPTLRHWPTAPSDRCVDAEALAAWVEGKLDAKQASAVELHVGLPALHGHARVHGAADTGRRRAEAGLEHGNASAMARPVGGGGAAIAIWIALPNRPVTQVPSASVPEASAAAKPRQDSARRRTRGRTSRVRWPRTRRPGANTGAGGRPSRINPRRISSHPFCPTSDVGRSSDSRLQAHARMRNVVLKRRRSVRHWMHSRGEAFRP